jgi:hypothetical protein
MQAKTLAAAVVLFALPAVAFAGPAAPPLPEPETLALLGIGAVALIIARWGKRK